MTPTYVDGNASGTPIWIAPDLWLMSPTVMVQDDEGVRMRLVVDSVESGTVGVVRIELVGESGETLDADDVRRLRFREAMIEAVMNAVHWSTDRTFGMNPIAAVLNALRPWTQPTPTGRYRLPTGEAYQALSAVHRAATLVGVGTATLLREGLDIPSTTARYWVEQLRTRGETSGSA